ncbi:MAG: primosomal protein N' [candidate division WOR-3 bacterium]
MIFYDFLVTGIPTPLTYKSEKKLTKGSLFYLKVKGKKRIGITLKENKNPSIDFSKIIDVKEEDYFGFTYPEKVVDFILWCKDYYRTSFDKVLQFFIPSSSSFIEREFYVFKKFEKNLEEKEKIILEFIKIKKRVSRKNLIKKFKSGVISYLKKLEKKNLIEREFLFKNKKQKFFDFKLSEINLPDKPTEIQKRIIDEFFEEKDKKIFLIHGVTGSGKTFIYREIVKRFLKEGKKALILVPEISLLPQIAPYFLFKDFKLFLYAFILNPDEKWDVLHHILSDEPCVVVGARSASFLPFKDLGVIIVDEEQEESYKEKEREPFYHTRDILIKRSELEDIPIIFGTATPSLEIYNKSKVEGKYFFIPERISGYRNPKVEIISLRAEPGRFYLTGKLLQDIEEVLSENKRVILFINKKGFAHFMQCKTCGFIPFCPNCSISLTYYKRKNLLLCHFCSWKEEAPQVCPNCKSINLKTSSFGTEKIEEELRSLFPKRIIKRMDRDAISGRKKVFEVFDDFIKGNIDILVGTQMVIKGLDNPSVGLAAFLCADEDLNFPDFRARERMFHRLIQLMGRVRKEGKTIIQTYNPDEKIFEKVLNFDIEGFYKEELEERKKFKYPPFSNLILIETNTKIPEDGEDILRYIKEKIKKSSLPLEILGPSVPPIAKIKGFYRNRLILKVEDKNLIKKVLDLVPLNSKIKLDLNPYDFL